MSELRQRKQPSGETTTEKSTATIAMIEKYCDAVASAAPASVKPYVENAKPLIGKAVVFTESVIIPYLYIAYEKYLEISVALQPYRLDLLTPAYFGIILCFFGGSYLTLIAAIEAYRIAGWTDTYKAIKDLYRNYELCLEADKKDNEVDDDKDGIPDTLELSPQALMQRKLFLFAKTVDPVVVRGAVAAIMAGWMAVVATLKLQFAAAITLGTSIGEILDKQAQRYIAPSLEVLLPPEFKRWAKPLVSFSVLSVAVSMAWLIQRVISAFHSSIRGGHMISRNLLEYLSVMKIYVVNVDETNADEILGYVLAGLGFLFQLSWGFRLPFLLSLVMFPFTVAEYFLLWAVTS